MRKYCARYLSLTFLFLTISCSSSSNDEGGIDIEKLKGSWILEQTDSEIFDLRGKIGIDFIGENFTYSFFENDSLVFHVGFYDHKNRFAGFSTTYKLADNVIEYYDPAFEVTKKADILYLSEDSMVWKMREGGKYFLRRYEDVQNVKLELKIDSISLATKDYCELDCDEFKLKVYPQEEKFLIYRNETEKAYQGEINNDLLSFLLAEFESGMADERFKTYYADTLEGLSGYLSEYKIYTEDTTYRFIGYGNNSSPHLLHASIAIYELERRNDLREIDSLSIYKAFQDIETPLFKDLQVKDEDAK